MPSSHSPAALNAPVPLSLVQEILGYCTSSKLKTLSIQEIANVIGDAETLSAAIHKLRDSGLIQAEDLAELRRIGREIVLASETASAEALDKLHFDSPSTAPPPPSAAADSSHHHEKRSERSHSGRRHAHRSHSERDSFESILRRKKSKSWHHRLSSSIHDLVWRCWKLLKEACLSTKQSLKRGLGKLSKSTWIMLAFTSVAALLLVYWYGNRNDASSSKPAVSQAASSSPNAVTSSTPQVDFTPVQNRIDANDYTAALNILNTLEGSSAAAPDIELLRGMLAQAGGSEGEQTLRILIENPQLGSPLWQDAFALWLISSTEESRTTMRDFLSSSEVEDDWTLYRLQAWLMSRHGDSKYAYRFLNQIEEKEATEADLLFRASACILRENFKEARYDLEYLFRMLQQEDASQPGDSLAATELSRSILRKKISTLLPRLQANVHTAIERDTSPQPQPK